MANCKLKTGEVKVYVLELTAEEAAAIVTLTRAVGGPNESTWRKHCDAIREALCEQGVPNISLSYSGAIYANR